MRAEALDEIAEERKAKSIFLHAWHDPVAGLKAFTPCVRMCDLSGDSEAKLLVASSDKKLKIYKSVKQKTVS